MSLPPPPRRARIKAPKKRAEPAQDTLVLLSRAIKQIQLHNASQLSFEEQYRYAYDLVMHKEGHTLYNRVAELIAEHLEKEARELVVPVFPPSSSLASVAGYGTDSMVSAAAGQLFLTKLREVWNDHIACMSKLRDVLRYMDKCYAGSHAYPSTWDLGLSLFLHHVVLYSSDPPAAPARPATNRSTTSNLPATPVALPTSNPSTVAHHLISTLLAQIRIERQGEPVSRSTLRNTVEMLCELTDETAVPLPIAASTGTGAGIPTGSGNASGRLKRPVMGEGMMGERDSPYKTSFEKVFLSQSQEFYQQESAELLLNCDAPTFLIKIEKRLREEADRAQTYLSPPTEPLLIALVEKTLITDHLSDILSHPASGLATLVLESRLEDLQRLYRLFGRVPTGHQWLREGLSRWIVDTGRQVNEGVTFTAAEEVESKMAIEPGSKVKAPPAPDMSGAKTKAALVWVQNVLDLKDKFDRLLANAFQSDKAFEKSINDAFTVFVNQNQKSPEYISLFVDENLRKGLKGKTEAEVDDVLNKTIVVFRFLTEKDVFEKYYNTHLAKRLVTGRSVSDDAERGMLAKFKIEAGTAFTKAAEGMMKDVKVSEDMMPAYKRYQERPDAVKAGFDMAVIVAGQNNWSISSGERACSLPTVLEQGILSFTKYYNSIHSGRLLRFHHGLGTVDVKIRFKARTHEVNVPTHAMVVLALFENLGNESVLYSDIAATTNIPAVDLKRTLQSLALGKYKILSKFPRSREVDDADSFVFNSGFTCPLAKFKIQQLVNKVETTDESKETEAKVEEARNLLCDACIVRVMKLRKESTHADVINEVVRQLAPRFQPRPSMIKQAIERLIEKEYIARNADDRKLLTYVA